MFAYKETVAMHALQRSSLSQIKVANAPGKKLEHQGIRVQLLGQIELKSERGAPNDFLSLGVEGFFPCSMTYSKACHSSANLGGPKRLA